MKSSNWTFEDLYLSLALWNAINSSRTVFGIILVSGERDSIWIRSVPSLPFRRLTGSMLNKVLFYALCCEECVQIIQNLKYEYFAIVRFCNLRSHLCFLVVFSISLLPWHKYILWSTHSLMGCHPIIQPLSLSRSRRTNDLTAYSQSTLSFTRVGTL